MPENYGTVEGFKDYHARRNHDIAVLTDDEIAAALLVASEWLDAKYRTQYPGTKDGDRLQLREWPRINANDIHGQPLDGIPREIDNATYEAAAIDGASPGALSINWTPGKYKSVSVEGAVSVVYASVTSVFEAQTQFAIIGEILSTILTNDGGGSAYVGQSVRW